MLCKICGSPLSQLFTATIMQKYEAEYLHCSKCGLIQTTEPVWLKEAYESPINLEDTGLLKRNMFFSQRTSVLLYFLFDKNGHFLDYAGGNGLFVRLMRDIGYDFYWDDPYTVNIFARGFEYDGKKPIELITSFESFEHFTDPLTELNKMLSVSRNILFSTELYSGAPPSPDSWAYYAFSHGQHVALYSYKTLKFLADKHGLNLYSNRKSFHLLTEKKLSELKYNLLLKSSAVGLSSLISRSLNSKTEQDSEMLANLKKKK